MCQISLLFDTLTGQVLLVSEILITTRDVTTILDFIIINLGLGSDVLS